MSGRRYAHLRRGMPDARSGRVVFVSHCLLNQNVRYLGGAVCPGVVTPAVEHYVADGTGIVQLPCPEQRVWGGVLKTRLLWVLEHPWIARGPGFVRAVTAHVRHRYTRLARGVVDDIEDYVNAGTAVCGLLGVAGSPSCGVRTTLDLSLAAGAIARCPRAGVSTAWMNDTVVGPALCSGSGLFIEAVTDELARRHLDVRVTEQVLAHP